MGPSIKVYTLMYTLRPLSGEWQRARRVGNATGRGLDECATWQDLAHAAVFTASERQPTATPRGQVSTAWPSVD